MELLNKDQHLEPQTQTITIGFQQITLCNGKTIECELSISWDYDDYFDVDDFEDDKELIEKINNNEISPMMIEVRASYSHVWNHAHLGGCLIDKPYTISEIINNFGIDGDLIPRAIEDLKYNLNELIKDLT